MFTQRKQNNLPRVEARIDRLYDTEIPLRLLKPLLLVSVGNPNHEEEYVEATIAMLVGYHQTHFKLFKNIDVLVAGTLQRHNFWNFCEKLTENELIKIMYDISENEIKTAEDELEKLATVMANEFYPYAKLAEEKYIADNNIHYCVSVPTSFRCHIIRWDQKVPGSSGCEGNTDEYFQHYREIKQQYAQDAEFKSAFDNTIMQYLKNKDKLIASQGERLAVAAATSEKPQLAALFRGKNLQQLVKICSRNYLFEECPLLFRSLETQGYTSIAYPGKATKAFKAAQEFFGTKISWLNIIQERIDPQKKITPITTPVALYSYPLQSLFSTGTRSRSSERPPVAVATLDLSPPSAFSDPGLNRNGRQLDTYPFSSNGLFNQITTSDSARVVPDLLLPPVTATGALFSSSATPSSKSIFEIETNSTTSSSQHSCLLQLNP